jgi:hypothetical protein
VEIRTAIAVVEEGAKITNATVILKPGDHLSVGIEIDGRWQTISISTRGQVIMVHHEQTQDALLIKPSGNQFVKG